MTGMTRQLARYVANATLADIPDAVQREGVRAFHNCSAARWAARGRWR